MAEVTLASSSQKAIWMKSFYSEYVRKNGFLPYMGTGMDNIIRVFKELITEKGKTINVPLFTALRGNGVSGSQVLVGNEDDLGNYNDQVKVDWKRNGVVVPKSTSYLTEVDVWNAGKTALREWAAKKLRNDIIDAFGSIIIPGSTSGDADTAKLYADSSAAERNAYLVNNSDRILMGALTANTSSGVWATALGNVDSTNDRLSTAVANLAKRLAQTTGESNASFPNRPAITPYTTDDAVYSGYVMFCAPNSFRDLQNDTAMIAANRDARAREGQAYKNNPLFMDGDLLYNGIIFRNIPELQRLTLSGVGASSINVDRNFLCGQASLSLAWGQMPTPRTRKEDDYEFRPGAGIEELRGQKKTSYLGTNYGVVEVLTASVADA